MVKVREKGWEVNDLASFAKDPDSINKARMYALVDLGFLDKTVIPNGKKGRQPVVYSVNERGLSFLANHGKDVKVTQQTQIVVPKAPVKAAPQPVETLTPLEQQAREFCHTIEWTEEQKQMIRNKNVTDDIIPQFLREMYPNQRKRQVKYLFVLEEYKCYLSNNQRGR